VSSVKWSRGHAHSTQQTLEAPLTRALDGEIGAALEEALLSPDKRLVVLLHVAHAKGGEKRVVNNFQPVEGGEEERRGQHATHEPQRDEIGQNESA
jgi:hypothetical protein